MKTRTFLLIFLCAALCACHKKAAIVPPPAPAPEAPPAAPTRAPAPGQPPQKKQVRKVPAPPPAAPTQPPPAPLGEFVDPAERQQILAEIDANLRQASSRVTTRRASLTWEDIRQIEGLITQAQEARSKNMLLTARRLSSRALALTQ